MIRLLTVLGTIFLLTLTVQGAATLTWTAPGDNGYTGGAVKSYDIRYSKQFITAENWDLATPLQVGFIPKPPGGTESITVDLFDEVATYYFALKTEDSSGNWSEISNIAAIQYCPHGCIGTRGNINSDLEELVDVSDLLFLVDYFFLEVVYKAPACPQECDLDNNGTLDIADLLFFVDYMFLNDPTIIIPDCPQ